jgi:hypothetical protein
MMRALKDWFENTSGIGVFSTADKGGKVNSAVFGRPYFLDHGLIGFIMLKRLNHHNLKSNAHASYLFIEEGLGRQGVRLHLTKTGEEQNTRRMQSINRHRHDPIVVSDRVLVLFRVDKVLPLVGDDLDKLPFQIE